MGDFEGNVYVFACQDCGRIHEVNDQTEGFGEAFEAWQESIYEDELVFKAPLPEKCIECGSLNLDRHPELEERGKPCNGFSRATGEQLIKRGMAQAADDMKTIASGEDGGEFVRNLAGEGKRPVDPGVKYLKDVKKGAVKRRS